MSLIYRVNEHRDIEETVFNWRADQLLVVVYNHQQLPRSFRPAQTLALAAVHVDYDVTGHVMWWQRGDVIMTYVYDGVTGQLTEWTQTDQRQRLVHRYVYDRNSRMVSKQSPTSTSRLPSVPGERSDVRVPLCHHSQCQTNLCILWHEIQLMFRWVCVCVCVRAQLKELILPSGKRYLFYYDNSSRLTSFVTPSHLRHEFQRLTMPGIDRLLYRAPHVKQPYIVDYDRRGRPVSVMYPRRARRVTYEYMSDRDDNDFDVMYDSTHVRHRRSTLNTDYTVQTSDVKQSDVNCSCVIQRTDNMTTTSVQVTLTTSDSHDVTALFVYRRDKQRRVTSLDVVIANHKLPTINMSYSDKSGQMMRATPFTCQQQRHRDRHCVSDDARLDVSRQYDDVNRLNKVIMAFNRRIVFTLQVRPSITLSVFFLDKDSTQMCSKF